MAWGEILAFIGVALGIFAVIGLSEWEEARAQKKSKSRLFDKINHRDSDD